MQITNGAVSVNGRGINKSTYRTDPSLQLNWLLKGFVFSANTFCRAIHDQFNGKREVYS